MTSLHSKTYGKQNNNMQKQENKKFNKTNIYAEFQAVKFVWSLYVPEICRLLSPFFGNCRCDRQQNNINTLLLNYDVYASSTVYIHTYTCFCWCCGSHCYTSAVKRYMILLYKSIVLPDWIIKTAFNNECNYSIRGCIFRC